MRGGPHDGLALESMRGDLVIPNYEKTSETDEQGKTIFQFKPWTFMTEEPIVNVKFTRELLNQLQSWSEPIQVRSVCNNGEWTLEIRRPSNVPSRTDN